MDWNKIVEKYPEANFLQSPAYGKMNELLGAKVIMEDFGDNQCALMIVRDAKRGRYLEIPCGPLLDWKNKTSVKKAFENAFNDLDNANIVKSVVPGFGFNFGHCDYVIDMYHALINMGVKVHICRCGIDPEQHCAGCHKCSECEYVLFVEHSTAYKATEDPKYSELVELIEHQKY